MNKRSLAVSLPGQHLEFMQWFSQRFNARRASIPWRGLTHSELVTKVTPMGIGVLYSKKRGAELIETRPPHIRRDESAWWLFHADHYQEFQIFASPFVDYDPSLPTYSDASPYIENRIRHWQSINTTTDLRKAVVLAQIFAWRPSSTPSA